MSDLLSQMAGDSDAALNLPDDRGLASVQAIADRIVSYEKRVKSLEYDLKEAKKKLLKLTDEDLPSKMQELGLSEFRLTDGSHIEIKQTYGARISEDNRANAFAWLRAKGEGDLIKNTISVRFGKKEDNEAMALLDDLIKRKMEPEQKEEVHASTLKAWVKDRTEQGLELDMDLFGVWIGNRATIKRAQK